MPRLIDADELYKKLVVFAEDDWNKRVGTTWSNAFIEISEMVEDAPTAVIRCKGCRFYNTHDHRCVRMNHGFKDDFFCSWGERKEDENNLH